MERRYRYPAVSGSKGTKRAVGQLIKFIIGWNIVGFLLWRSFKKHARSKDPQGTEYFDKRPDDEKILIMKGINPDKEVPHLKVSLSGIEKEQWIDDNTLEKKKLTLKGFQKISDQVLNSKTAEKTDLMQKENDDIKNQAPSPSQTTESSPTQDNKSGQLQNASYSLGSIFSFSWFRKQDES